MDLLDSLVHKLDEQQHTLTGLDRYYAGRQPLAFLAPEAKEALGNRLTRIGTNVCRLAVTSLAERLRIIGFTRGQVPDPALWSAWVRNDLDQQAGVAHREALALGRSFVTVWADRSGRAKVTVESARQMVTQHDPATRQVVAAVKKWEAGNETFAVLYEADVIRWFRADRAGAISGFKMVDELVNPLGEVPVTVLQNGDRLLDEGVSEMADLLPLVDALAKIEADMMVSSEYYARPRRWATGVELVEDANGEAVNPFTESIKMMISESPDSKFGSLPAADLGAYEAAVRILTSQIMAVSGLPAHYLGVLANQPSSADALRAAEASLTARAEDRQHTFGRSWERVARQMVAVESGVDPESLEVAVQWADPATRSVAQEADAVVKLYAAGLLPASYALAKLGYTDAEIGAIRQARRTERLDAVGTDLAGLLP